MIATGGIATGRGVAAVLACGAHAAMLGTAFMRCPEAATSAAHAAALEHPAATVMTRAFTGRAARALANEFTRTFDKDAPAAYPEVQRRPARCGSRRAPVATSTGSTSGRVRPTSSPVRYLRPTWWRPSTSRPSGAQPVVVGGSRNDER